MRLLKDVFLVGGLDYHLTFTDWPSNDANAYLIDTRDTLVLVDCGCGETLPEILANIQEHGLDARDLSHLLLTHEHLPHCGAAQALEKMKVTAVAHEAAAEAVRAADRRTGTLHYHKPLAPVEVAMPVKDGDTFEVGAASFRVLHLPGHSPGSCAYELLIADKRIFFAGDLAFCSGRLGRRDHFGYDAGKHEESIIRLREEEPEILMPGHGPMSLGNAATWLEEALLGLLSR